MKRFYLFITLSVVLGPIQAQEYTQISHYSVDNGLSENHVLCMLQDSKGNMWFGTYSGLDKFDGYSFRNFKGRLDQKYQLLNSRIDRLKEDQQGFLWIQTNDSKIYRFDPSTETFLPVPNLKPGDQSKNIDLNRINILSNGDIWLSSSEAINDGCFKVENTDSSAKIRLRHYSTDKGDLGSNNINKIYLDQDQNTWLLTAAGIRVLKELETKTIPLFPEIEVREFYAISEDSINVYLGGTSGKLLIYNKKDTSHQVQRTPFSATIIDIQHINAHDVLLLTNTANFYIYNTSAKTFEVFAMNSQAIRRVHGCFKDKENKVWMDTEYAGAIYFNPKTKTINYLPVGNIEHPSYMPQKFYLVEDHFNNTWVQIRNGGFYKFNKTRNQLEELLNSNFPENDLSNQVHTAITDDQGNLWLSTYLQGIDKMVFQASSFTFIKQSKTPLYSLNNEIRSVYEDSRNWLWIGTKKGLVYIYDEQRQLKGSLGSDGKINGNNPLNAAVYDIMEDHTGTVWLATKGMGLFSLDKNSDDSFDIHNFTNAANNSYSLSSNSVYKVFEDQLQNIWIGTFGGGLNLMDKSGATCNFINTNNRLHNYPIADCSKIRFITEGPSGNLFLGTTQGLLIFNPQNKTPEEISFERYFHKPKEKESLSGNDVEYILPSSTGDIYLTLAGGGVNIVKGGLKTQTPPQFEVLKNNNTNSANIAYTLIEDKKGCIWMSMQTQILKYNPAGSSFETYKPLSTDNYFFSEAAVCQTRSGEIIYGTSDGFVSFNPLITNKSDFIPRISLTSLHIDNEPVHVGDNNSPLESIIDDTKDVVLRHNQNIFSITFSALDYKNPDAIQYAYKLDGLESQWNYVGNMRIANYISLKKGDYRFRVKSTNADGEWVNNERTLHITKLPSFWESTWGLLFYFLIFFLLASLIAYILFIIYRLRNEIGVEKRMSDMKLRFFTDISHELRTPLTLIISPIDNILKREPLSINAKEQLLVVQKNTRRLLTLINQILDFRKINTRKMRLFIESIHVATFLDEVCASFKKLAEQKNIHLKISDFTKNTQIWIDKDKFEKIFFNLLSNAFKFTPSNNEIHLVITDDPDHINISLYDEGIGISKDKLKLLFDRFESFTTSKNTFQASSGIGLSLIKELVELHHAKIKVESETGKGSAFKLVFKKGYAHFGKNDEFLLHDLQKIDPNSELPNPMDTNECLDIPLILSEKSKKQTNHAPRILIVEDNIELQSFLNTTLSLNYQIFLAGDGIVALDIALNQNPDLIISDIMMPDMDGLELSKRLKQDINTSHIPLILLSAKSDMESKLLAMDMGVDDYITKPFSLTFLEARIENLLKIRAQLQTYFHSSLTSGVITLSKPNVSTIDERFLQKTMLFLEENYDNSTISIDNIADVTGVSRSSFFKKVKSLTGLAPVEFIREFRLQKSTQLIESGETNVAQLGYSVGINDPRYFSKCFKQKFGLSPSEFMAKKTGQD